LLVAGTVPEGEGDMGYFAEQSNVVPHFIPEMSRNFAQGLRDDLEALSLVPARAPRPIHTHTAKAGNCWEGVWLFLPLAYTGVIAGRPRKVKFVHTYHGYIFIVTTVD
jgi:hypothetical protein